MKGAKAFRFLAQRFLSAVSMEAAENERELRWAIVVPVSLNDAVNAEPRA